MHAEDENGIPFAFGFHGGAWLGEHIVRRIHQLTI